MAASYDFIAIGSGPAGQRAAVQAAKVGAKVAVVSPLHLGGVCINTGTIPSKTLREAIIDLSGSRQRRLYGMGPPVSEVTGAQLLARTQAVIQREREVIRHQLERNGIDVHCGFARFEGPHEISYEGPDGSRGSIEGRFVLVSVGTVPARPRELDVDHETVLTSDDILSLPRLPQRLLVAGAGVIGVEYASMFAALGVDVSLCDVRETFLDSVDGQIRELFRSQLERGGVRLHLGERIARLETGPSHHHRVVMESGHAIDADVVLVSAGRQGNTAGLALDRAGLVADDRGRLKVDAVYRTAVAHIYAAGDVIGAPQLAATSAEQGRLAACHALGLPTEARGELLPYGIYAIPEIAWVGKTEEDLVAEAVPHVTGLARYGEIARGNILGDFDGLLKLLIHRESHDILGVWICGTHASELVHIGQAVMALGGRLEYLVRTVFNYPTLAECYKVAAFDGMNKLRGYGGKPPAAASPAC
ncbi:MAG TPA: Si-specific NAD(P)(+) transhydrogenase [Myxococcales bacterium]|nr:Si-specific NAD(P)(+) transhydrogenase [Myxococcales bacterium]